MFKIPNIGDLVWYIDDIPIGSPIIRRFSGWKVELQNGAVESIDELYETQEECEAVVKKK